MAPFSLIKQSCFTSVDSNSKTLAQQFILFVINGGILGIIAWLAQLGLHYLLGGTSLSYGIATALIYPPLIIINFMIQRKFIFSHPGCFKRFIIANVSIMLLVSVLSPFTRWWLTGIINIVWGDRLGFVLAALIGAVPSFLLKRYWVFKERHHAV